MFESSMETNEFDTLLETNNNVANYDIPSS